MNTYTIRIPKLKLFGYHGFYDKEIEEGQEFEISMNITFEDDGKYAMSDELNIPYKGVVDYVVIQNQIKKLFHDNKFSSLERLAKHIVSNLNLFDEDFLEFLIKDIMKNSPNVEDIVHATDIGLECLAVIDNPISIELIIRKFNPEKMDVPYIDVVYTKKEGPWINRRFLRDMDGKE